MLQLSNIINVSEENIHHRYYDDKKNVITQCSNCHKAMNMVLSHD
jgi:hypothetical protein